jgi:Na+-driven multidrug efflux pump
VGAGNERRAKRAAFTGAAMGALPCGLLGLAVSVYPAWWTTIFSSDAAVLATGGLYLHWVGPMYVLLAMGAALFFASQGAGRVLWPVLSASARLLVILVGGSLLTLLGAPLWAVCALAASGILIYGVTIIASVYRTRWAA